MVKYNTFELSKHRFLYQCSLKCGALLHIKGSIGTQRVYINAVRNFIKKKCNLNEK